LQIQEFLAALIVVEVVSQSAMHVHIFVPFKVGVI